MRAARCVLVLVLSVGLLAADEAAAPPEHDLQENAIRIPELPFTHEFDASAATGAEVEDEPCDLRGDPERTVWYRFHADRDMNIEFAVSRGTPWVDVVDPETCQWGSFGRDEARLKAGTDYLIRASTVAGDVTFATREYNALQAPVIELFPLARVDSDGNLELTSTIVCDRPGEVELMFYAAQLNNTTTWYLTSNDPFETVVVCEGETSYTAVLPPGDGEAPFRPGPVEIWWDAGQCIRDSFRYPGWESCPWAMGNSDDVVAVPAVP